MSLNWGFWDFDKIMIDSYVLILLEYEQSFQVGLVSMLEMIESTELTISQKMNIGMNLIFCVCHNYVYLYDSVH